MGIAVQSCIRQMHHRGIAAVTVYCFNPQPGHARRGSPVVLMRLADGFVRNIVAILETLADFRPVTKDTSILVEKVRQALGRQICLQYAGDDKVLRVITVENSLVQKIVDSRLDTVNGPVAALEPAVHRAWIKALTHTVAAVQKAGYTPVILCPEEARILIKVSTEREIPDLVVLSVPEISADIQVEAVGEIKLED